MLEDRIRAAMRAAAADVPPPVAGLLDEMIHAARKTRRRRRVGYTAAVAVSMLAAFGVVVDLSRPEAQRGTSSVALAPSPSAVVLQSAPEPEPTPEPSQGLPLDTVRSGELSTMDGREIPLPERVDPAKAYRVPLGWLAIGSQGIDRPLWLVRSDGSILQLAATMPDAMAVAPDGGRIAWQAKPGAPIRTAVITSYGLNDFQYAQVTPTTRLLGWFGDYVAFGDSGAIPDNSVQTPPGPRDSVDPTPHQQSPGASSADVTTPDGWSGVVSRVDVWNPDRPYKATWAPDVSGILGLAADRTSLIALRATALHACLVILDPLHRLAAGASRCVSGVEPTGRFTVSPSGRWLAARSDRTHLVIFTTDILTGAHPTVEPLVELPCVWDATEVWVDDRTALVPQPNGFLRYRVGSAAGVPVPLVQTGASIMLVPRFGA